jgi:transposase InsO family protein
MHLPAQALQTIPIT